MPSSDQYENLTKAELIEKIETKKAAFEKILDMSVREFVTMQCVASAFHFTDKLKSLESEQNVSLVDISKLRRLQRTLTEREEMVVRVKRSELDAEEQEFQRKWDSREQAIHTLALRAIGPEGATE